MSPLRVPLAVAVVGAVVLASLASRVRDWAVMTDELLYERLAISIADGGLPRVHGELVGVYALLYPIVVAPVFALFSMPTAIVAAHAWNGVLFASAAIPAYLFARRLPAPRWTAVAAALLAVALPWSTTAAFLMTENAAYPAFLWAALAIQRATVAPSDANHVTALGAIALATLARPQLVGLALVLPLVVAAHDTRFARDRGILRRRRALLVVYGVGIAGVAVVAVASSAGALAGVYAPAVEEGQLLSRAVVRSAAVHVDVVAVALGVVPLIVGGGWALAAVVRPPEDDESYTLAALTVAVVGVLALEAGSVVVRFPLGLDVKDRYLFYIAPILVLATIAALADRRPRLLGMLAAALAFVATVRWERFETVYGLNADSPGSVLHELFTRAGEQLAVRPDSLVALVVDALALTLIVALRFAPRSPVRVAVLGATVLFCVLETGYAWDRLLGSISPSGRHVTAAVGADRAWVDRALPDGADVGMLAYSVGQDWLPSALAWWDAEFWNARVTRAYLVGDQFTYTPETFPRPRLAVDGHTGLIQGDAPRYLLRTTLDARFRPVGPAVAIAPEFEVVALDRPARAAWLTIGLTPDGWTTPGTRAALRVFGTDELVVTLTLNSPDVEEPRGYDLGGARVGYLGSTTTRELQFLVCVTSGGYVDVPIRVLGATAVREIPDRPPYAESFREVGLRLTRISAVPTGTSC